MLGIRLIEEFSEMICRYIRTVYQLFRNYCLMIFGLCWFTKQELGFWWSAFVNRKIFSFSKVGGSAAISNRRVTGPIFFKSTIAAGSYT